MSETITGTSVPSETSPAGMGDGTPGMQAFAIPNESRCVYWHRQLSGVPVLTLPTHKPGSAVRVGQFASRSRQVEKNHADHLRRFSQQQSAPLSVVLLSAFHAVVVRYTSQEDFVVGCALANLDDAINGTPSSGHNAFLLRVDLSGDPTFRDLVSRCYAGALESRMQGRSTLADLMEELTADLGVQSPTFQISFSYENGDLPLEWASGPAERPSPTPDVPVDLHLSVNDGGEGLSLCVVYNRELFDPQGIDRTLEHLEVVLRSVEQSPDQHLSTLPLMTEEEKHQVLIEWNKNVRDYPRDKCLHQLVEAQAEHIAERPAVAQAERQLSYCEFNEQANQLAHYLRSLGVGNNVKVGICLRPELEFPVAVLAVMKAGAACVPLDPNYPQERLAYMLHDAQARVLITQEGMLQAEVPAGCQTLILSSLTEVLSTQPRTNPDSEARPHHTAYVIYTSGSTGKPRGVLLSHAGLVNYLTATSEMCGVGQSDRMLQFCSVSFDIAIEEMFTIWVGGGALVLRTAEMSLAVPEFLAWVEKQKVTILDLPTAYWHEWVHHFAELKRPVPPSVRLVIVGGEKASAKSFGTWSNTVRGRVRWINTYGPTEASICVTAFEPKFGAADAIPENLPIGRPVANCRIFLLDQRLNPVPVSVPGELYIGGVCVAQGYHNRPELTAEKFIPDPFSNDSDARLYKTGDMARYLPSGEIEFLGRRDDQVKIRGFRVELGEIEAALAKYPHVSEVAVVAREDVPGNKLLVAYLVPARNSRPTPIELRHYLQQALPDYMVPSTFVLLQSMPLTPNGKINRRGLPVPEVEVHSDAIAPATDPFQSQLVMIWEEVLGRKPIGIRDNFFELGGHSLLAARLMHRIGQALGKSVPLAMLLEAPTIEHLATTLRQDGWSHHWSSLVPIQPDGSHLPFFCIHGVGGNVVGFHELAQHMKPDYPLYGLQSQGLDGRHSCHTRIEDMAAHYLDEIHTVQAKGPYHLGGFSLGGLVAYEMACQLVARGEEVGLLVLFDTYAGNVKSANESLLDLLRHPTWAQLRQLPQALRKKVRRTFRMWRLPQALKNVMNTNARAAEQYRLRPYSGKATLLRAGDTWRASEDPRAGWGELVRALETIEIPGGHMDILREPHVSRVAEILKGCIDGAHMSEAEVLVRNVC
jgi:amino acid adenylation domain-containing protein